MIVPDIYGILNGDNVVLRALILGKKYRYYQNLQKVLLIVGCYTEHYHRADNTKINV